MKNIFNKLLNKRWFVVQSTCGKYADGWYGWDGHIHSDEQIFAENELPYRESSFIENNPGKGDMHKWLVGTGKKPSVHEAIDALEKLEQKTVEKNIHAEIIP